MANLITGSRIVLSVALLFCPALSPVFFVLYIVAGITDMIDGAVARRTGTASAFGARLDTIADFVFTAVCLIKLLPVLHVPVWLLVWVAVIASYEGGESRSWISPTEKADIGAFCTEQADRRAAVRFSADACFHRCEVRRGSRLHGCNCRGRS